MPAVRSGCTPGIFSPCGATAMAEITSDRIGDFGIEPLKLLQFMARFAARGSQRMVCKGTDLGDRGSGQSEMDELLGGWIIYTTPQMDRILECGVRER